MYYYFRKDFRPCYGRIGMSGSLFPDVPILALTATSSTQRKKLHQLREINFINSEKERNYINKINNFVSLI
jgi:superfamily II DNA helicase RecQ